MHFYHLLLCFSYEAQCIDCGVVAISPDALNAIFTSTEAGWTVSFIVRLKICRVLKTGKLVSNITFGYADPKVLVIWLTVSG